jgi:hypothetical protein
MLTLSRHAERRCQQRQESRMDRERINHLLAAYRAGNVGAFYSNMTSDLFPWTKALREFAKLSTGRVKLSNSRLDPRSFQHLH